MTMAYIAGPMTGRPNLNREAFAEAADRLRMEGWQTYNPAAANLEGMPLHRIMAHVLTQLCEAQAIVMLRGWWKSPGARVEWLLARYLGLRIIYL